MCACLRTKEIAWHVGASRSARLSIFTLMSVPRGCGSSSRHESVLERVLVRKGTLLKGSGEKEQEDGGGGMQTDDQGIRVAVNRMGCETCDGAGRGHVGWWGWGGEGF